MKYICVSSSISNFRDKLLKKYPHFIEFRWRNILDDKFIVFFGMYHPLDYARLIFYRGQKQVVWCGSDVLNLKKSVFRHIIWRINATHVCENEVELLLLRELGMKAYVKPLMFDDPSKFKISYKHSKYPHVYLCAHKGSEEQYGVNLAAGLAATMPEITFHIYGITGTSTHNLIYHGEVPSEQFDQEITRYQAALRLNDFDGFGEVLAKSVLLGQHPISRIYYPFIDYAKDMTALISLLKDLKNKKKPNRKAEKYWREIL